MGTVIGRVLGRLVQKGLSEIELNTLIKKFTHITIAMEEIIAHGLEYFIYFIVIIMALRKIGIATSILNILSIGVIIIIILTIFLSIKDFIPNAVAGVRIHYKKIIQKGDHLTVMNMQGKVVEIGLLDTRIITIKGDLLYVPNILISQHVIKISRKSLKH